MDNIDNVIVDPINVAVLRSNGGGVFVAQATDPDACLVGRVSPDGAVTIDRNHPLIDNRKRPALYGGTYGCFSSYEGADGSVWVCELPETFPHQGVVQAGPPWNIFRVAPNGHRDRWTLASGDFVQTMAPAPHNAMWFVTGKRHQLGVLNAAGHVSEDVADLPPTSADLLATGRTTLYLLSDDAVRVITVPVS